MDPELERLLRQRELLWRQTLRAMSESLMIKNTFPSFAEKPEPERSQQAFGLSSVLGRASEEYQQEEQSLKEMRSRDELLGAAHWYNIPDPESLPTQALLGRIEERRELARDANGVYNVHGRILDAAVNAVGLGLIGLSRETGHFTENVIAKIPWIGDALVRSEGRRESDQWLATLEEGLVGDMPSYGRELSKGIAGAVGMLPAAFLTWEALGLAGTLPRIAPIGARVFPAGRAMLRGALTNAALQDPTAPLAEQGVNTAIGAAMGLGVMAGPVGRTVTGVGLGALAGSLASEGDPTVTLISAATGGVAFATGGKLLSKLQRDFPSRALERSQRVEGTADGPPIVEAEWSFVDDPVGLLMAPRSQNPSAPPVVRPQAPPQPQEPLITRANAPAEAAALTKQGAIIESPALAELSHATKLDDADVARALVDSYPGQVGVVQNVGDIGSTVRKILQEQMPRGVGPQDYRVVKRPAVYVEVKGEGPDFLFEATTAEGVPYRALASLSPEGQLETIMAPRDFSFMTEGEPPRPGLGWLRQFGGEIAYQLEQRDLPVSSITGMRGSGARAGADVSVARAAFPVSRLPRQVVNDILVSAGRPISNQMVADYERFGMFAGQRAHLPSGAEVTIEALGADQSLVKPLFGGVSTQVRTSDILPLKSSYVVDDLPGFYENFSAYAGVRLAQQSMDTGVAPVELLSGEGMSQMPLLMEEFIASTGVDPNSYYGKTLKQVIEQRHVEQIRTLAEPEDQAFLQGTKDFYVEVQEGRSVDIESDFTVGDLPSVGSETIAPMEIIPAEILPAMDLGPVVRETDVTALDQLAEARGFMVSPEGLVDVYTGEIFSVESPEAVREFLQGFQRETLDDSPPGTFPHEVMQGPADFSAQGGVLPGQFVSAEHHDAALALMERDVDQLLGVPPGQPPAGGSGLPPGRGGMLPGPRDPRNEVPYIRGLQRMDGIVSKLVMPTRHQAIRADAFLRQHGLPTINLQLQNLQDARARMVSESVPWENEAIEALQGVRRKVVRDGSMVGILFSPPQYHQLLADKAGLTPSERVAIGKIGMLLQRFNNEVARPFMPGLPDSFTAIMSRFEESLPGDPFVRPKQAMWGSKEPPKHAYAEKDLGAFFGRYFRSFFKVKHMNGPYREIQQLIGKPLRAPSSLERVQEKSVLPGAVRSWLQKVSDDTMWGIDPTGDIVLKATHNILNKAANLVGQSVSKNEIQSFFNWMVSSGYAALLGDVDSFFRDLPQGLTGIAHIGFDKGMPIFTRLVRDKAYREEATQRALRYGWITPEHGLSVDPDVFGGTTYREVMPTRETSITQQEPVAQGLDFVHDKVLTPLGLERGWQHARIAPMRAYGAQSDFMRVWNAEAGYQTAKSALKRYAVWRQEPTLPTQAVEAQLLRESRMDRFQGPLQQDFLTLARSGDLENAARFLGRQMADKQTRYGMAEQPEFWRKAGPITGRLAMRLRTYSSQMVAELAQIGADPHIKWRAKASFFGQLSAMQLLAAAAQSKTGWNLMRLGVAGALWGVAGTGIFGVINATQRMLAYFSQYDPTRSGLDPTQEALLATSSAANYGSTYFTLDPSRAMWNPYSSYMRSASALAGSVQWGPEGVARTLLTGQQGPPWLDRAGYAEPGGQMVPFEEYMSETRPLESYEGAAPIPEEERARLFAICK